MVLLKKTRERKQKKKKKRKRCSDCMCEEAVRQQYQNSRTQLSRRTQLKFEQKSRKTEWKCCVSCSFSWFLQIEASPLEKPLCFQDYKAGAVYFSVFVLFTTMVYEGGIKNSLFLIRFLILLVAYIPFQVDAAPPAGNFVAVSDRLYSISVIK